MPDRIHLLSAPTPLPQVREGRAERQQRVADLLLTGLIPVGDLEAAGTWLAGDDRILQGMDLLDVPGSIGVDQDAYRGKAIAGTDLVAGQGVPAPP